ncbi:DUF1439 domain-containing protein [Vibrio sp. JC009]|uniref:DUF1439 domain-containing protein n=1 Tax=Vibrio sp. JC009 TaxID=2912314 RepID=UPI0023B0F906|nr:DUF1439 domain-containing protein [Vibrio sp. JC009]WED24178.1 DUF1439 domain-containing protein [Vibrio sp. JC009]
MIKKATQLFILISALFSLSACVSLSVTEGDISSYLQDNMHFEHSVGVENVMYAQVSVEDLKVKIGRADTDRISVFANTGAQIEMFAKKDMSLDLDIEFSAVPEYDAKSGEIFLKSLRLEQFNEKNRTLPPELETLLKPAVSMIGFALSQQPVYKLDDASVQAALLKTAEPNLVIKDNKLVIELLE